MTTPSNRDTLYTITSRPKRDATSDIVPTNSTLNIEITNKFSGYDNEYRLPLERDTVPPPCKQAFLCVFSIDVNPQPYVQYLLYKYDGDDGLLTFPLVAQNHKGGDNLLKLADALYAKCCGQDISTTSPLGFIQKDEQVYLFYEYSAPLPLQTIQSSHRLWWTLLDEICNHKKLLTFPVDSSVYQLFYEYQSLCEVMNSKNELVPAPKIAYYGAGATTLAYAAAIGVQQSDPKASFGPFYYFSTFNRSMRFSIWDYQRSSTQIGTQNQNLDRSGKTPIRIGSGGVVRHAVFTGGPLETYVPLGNKREAIDESEVAKIRRGLPRAKDATESDKKKLARLTDHDAVWATSWSSVVSGTIKGENVDNLNWIGIPKERQSYDPVTVVKDFTQQTPLSVHYVSSEGIKGGWRNDVFYTIS